MGFIRIYDDIPSGKRYQKTMESGDLTNKNGDCSWDLKVVDRNYPLVNIAMENHHL
jgi:hypothetical protein